MGREGEKTHKYSDTQTQRDKNRHRDRNKHADSQTVENNMCVSVSVCVSVCMSVCLAGYLCVSVHIYPRIRFMCVFVICYVSFQATYFTDIDECVCTSLKTILPFH